jgi:integrase
LALGLRQGEALGLPWTDINLDESALIVRRSRLRPKPSGDDDDQADEEDLPAA